MTIKAQMNLDFENWTDTTYYQEPEGYFTFNFESYFNHGVANVKEVQGASGSAMRLESMVTATDTTMGVANLGEGANLFGGGIAYTGMPDSLKITARYDMAENDSASIWMVFQTMNFPQFFQFNLGGSDTNWNAYTFPIDLSTQPDSLTATFASSLISGTPVDGSWIEIDKVELVGTDQQLPNSEYSDWREVGTKKPDGWFSADLIISILGDNTSSVTQSTDANSGTYACEITSVEVDLFGNADTFGILTNQPGFPFGNVRSGIPYNDQPGQISFDYKSEPQGNDSAVVWVRFATTAGDSINGGIEKLPQSSSYTTHQINFDWSGKDQPDSLLIVFSATNEFGGKTSVGSQLTIDNIQMSDPSGLTTTKSGTDNSVSAYPNPAGNMVHFKLEGELSNRGVLSVFNATGQAMKTIEMNSSRMSLDVSGYKPGIYLYELTTNEATYSGRFLKQ